MLSLSNISKAFGGRSLFEDVSLQINMGDRIALVGPNGAGKSTLFSIILRALEPDSGDVAMERGTTLGYLPQETAATSDETVLELATAITPEHAALRRTLNSCETRGETDSEAYHDAQGKYAELGGYQLDPKAKRILNGLAFRETDFNRAARTMSGGWVMRAYLARLLVMEPDLLMLDEPTNHLDLESLGWFQDYLTSYPGAILMISHDRAFLNELVDNILEIRNHRVNRYRGNYDDYLVQRAAREEQQLSAYKNQQKEIESLQRFADRFRAKASKASQAQSKLKQIDRMEKIEAPEAADRRIKIKFPQPPRSGQRVITLENIHHAYGDLVVYQGIQFEAERGQRTVLVGPNGAGKSTLLKILGGVLPVQAGERKLGHNAHVGYYSQNRVDMLKPANTVLGEVMGIPKPVPEQTARTVLGSFLFQGDDVFKKVSVLSGGEKSRLALVKLLLDPPNLLLMDEPTTHLDMASIDALVDALHQYHGTLVFISHDVYFIRALAKTVLHIHSGKLTPYAGDYDYYLEKSKATSERSGLTAGLGLSNAQPLTDISESPAKPAIFKTREQKKLEAQEREARSKARKQIQLEVDRIEKEILRLEEREKEIAAKLEDPRAYEHGGEALQLNREMLAATEDLTRLNGEWNEALQKLEAVKAVSAKPAD
ncbi:MAG: ABC-F family ATP-binding cassette domain-containing protein [Methylacidiphilales bacterium]|nr:ABC-F family ATP-binding cassette domain-containing protein [Candidatus Methylacidiphilales bacterium]